MEFRLGGNKRRSLLLAAAQLEVGLLYMVEHR